MAKYTGSILFFLFFCLFFSPQPLLNKIVEDDASYLAHALTIALDHDLNYTNEPVSTLSANNKLPCHPIGSGILASPFVATFSVIDILFRHPIITSHLDYFGSWSIFGFTFAVSIFFLLGIYFYLNSLKRLELISDERWLAILLCLASGIPYFVLVRYFFSHGFEFFSIALLFWCIVNIYQCLKQGRNKRYFLLLYASVFSLNFFVRYSNINLFILAPIIFLVINFFIEKKENQIEHNKFWKTVLTIFIVNIIALVPNILFNFKYFDTFLLKPSTVYNNSFGIEETSLTGIILKLIRTIPYILNITFGSELGLIYTNPIIPIGFICFFIIIITKKYASLEKNKIKYYFLLTVLVLFYFAFGVSIHLWWQGLGSTYGYRYLSHCFPVALLCTFILYKFFKKHYKKTYYIFFRTVLLILSFISLISLGLFGSTDKLSMSKKKNTFGIEKMYSANGYMVSLPGEIIRPYTWIRMLGRKFPGFVVYPMVSHTGLFSHNFNRLSAFFRTTEQKMHEDIAKYIDNYSTANVSLYIQVLILLLTWVFAGKILFGKVMTNNAITNSVDNSDNISKQGCYEMKNNTVLIVDFTCSRRGVVNKDVNAGLGTRTTIGNAWKAIILEKIKNRGVKLPLIELAYMSALLKNKGYEVIYFNQKATKNLNELESVIRGKKISFLIFNPSIVSYKQELDIVKAIKSKFPCIKIGATGGLATLYPEPLQQSFDWVLKGEPEYYFLNNDINSLNGLVIENGKVENLDDLPFPDWSIFTSETKFSYKPMINKVPFFSILGSKGCSMSCKYYCPYPTRQGTKYRKRSAVSLIKEIRELQLKYQVRAILFRDPFFSFDRNRTVEFARNLIENKIKITWACETLLGNLNEEILHLLHKSGLRSINIGVESNDEKILKQAQRKCGDLSRQEELIAYCDKIGIKVNAFFIIGFMKDTRKSILKMIDYAKSLKTFSTQFTVNTPLPGTTFYSDIVEKINDSNLENFDNNTLVFEHPNLSKSEIAKFKEKAFIEYYFRLSYFWRYLKWVIRDISFF